MSTEQRRAYQREYYLERRDEIREKSRAYYVANREAIRQKRNAYREAHAAEDRQYQRQHYAQNRTRKLELSVRYRHGLSPEEWAAIWQAQDGRCYLCGDELAHRDKTYVDHDHSHCGKRKSCQICRRGMACRHCNSAIGLAADDPARLRRMADALETAQYAFAQRLADSQAGKQLTLSDMDD